MAYVIFNLTALGYAVLLTTELLQDPLFSLIYLGAGIRTITIYKDSKMPI